MTSNTDTDTDTGMAETTSNNRGIKSGAKRNAKTERKDTKTQVKKKEHDTNDADDWSDPDWQASWEALVQVGQSLFDKEEDDFLLDGTDGGLTGVDVRAEMASCLNRMIRIASGGHSSINASNSIAHSITSSTPGNLKRQIYVLKTMQLLMPNHIDWRALVEDAEPPLLQYLCRIHPDQVRDAVKDAAWPDAQPDSVRANLCCRDCDPNGATRWKLLQSFMIVPKASMITTT